MKIAVVQLNPIVGDLENNAAAPAMLLVIPENVVGEDPVGAT